jgi:putative ABC transport system substrate-binding protein
MSYGANDVATYAQVASYIDQIFKGAKPGDLPIWLPSKLHLVINLRTAKALGLALPPSLLARADEVFQ